MGWTSEMVAKDFNIPRAKMDEYGLRSHTLASKATASGRFADEIVPVQLEQPDGSTVTVDKDDGIRHGTTMDKMASARAAFPDWGDSKSTGANSSQLTDGAAACWLMKRSKAEELGLEILAKHVSTSVIGSSCTLLLSFDIAHRRFRCRAAPYGHRTERCNSKSAGKERPLD